MTAFWQGRYHIANEWDWHYPFHLRYADYCWRSRKHDWIFRVKGILLCSFHNMTFSFILLFFLQCTLICFWKFEKWLLGSLRYYWKISCGFKKNLIFILETKTYNYLVGKFICKNVCFEIWTLLKEVLIRFWCIYTCEKV